jgi:hypothetical protein
VSGVTASRRSDDDLFGKLAVAYRDACAAHVDLVIAIKKIIAQYVPDDEDDIEPEDGWRLVRDLRQALEEHR